MLNGYYSVYDFPMRVVLSMRVHSSGRHISTQIPVRVVADVTHRNILFVEDLAGEGLVR